MPTPTFEMWCDDEANMIGGHDLTGCTEREAVRHAVRIGCERFQEKSKTTIGESICQRLKIINGHVEIAGPVALDYNKYQIRNDLMTTDFAVTVVMGLPFRGLFSKQLIALRDEACKSIAKLAPSQVTVQKYDSSHFHATICPIVRTKFNHTNYVSDPESVNDKQKAKIERKLPHDRIIRIEKAINHTKAFEITNVSKIMIGARGEVLAWGRADATLADLRKRLKSKRDTGSNIHIALSTISNFHVLTRNDKVALANRINEATTPTISLPSYHVDELTLAYYGHRSLSKVERRHRLQLCRKSC